MDASRLACIVDELSEACKAFKPGTGIGPAPNHGRDEIVSKAREIIHAVSSPFDMVGMHSANVSSLTAFFRIDFV